jgi:hypothetical protein
MMRRQLRNVKRRAEALAALRNTTAPASAG